MNIVETEAVDPRILALKQAPVGTPIFHVPIRYWEVQEPETGHIADYSKGAAVTPESEALHAADMKFIYAYLDTYGHNVYLGTADSFLTPEEAVAEALRRKEEKEAKDKAEFDELWAKMQKEPWFPGNKS